MEQAMTPAEYRALAARVETEEPTEALNEAVARALGWRRGSRFHLYEWKRPSVELYHEKLPDYLTDLTAAASAMPGGWWVRIRQDADGFVCEAFYPQVAVDLDWLKEFARAPDEERARVAAALRARASGMEAGE